MQLPTDGTKGVTKMPIDGGLRSKLGEGTTLVAKYKGTEHRAHVVRGEGGKLLFRLADGREFKSPSSAGSAVMDGITCNGWRFWSISDGTATQKPRAPKTAKPSKAAATTSATSAPGGRPSCE